MKDAFKIILAILMLWGCNKFCNIFKGTGPSPETTENSKPTRQLSDSEIVVVIEKVETVIKDAHKTYMKAENQWKKFQGLYENFSVSLFEVYKTAEIARDHASNAKDKLYYLNVPDGLPKNVRKELNTSISNASTSFYTRIEAFETLMRYYDNPKPSILNEFSNQLLMSEEFMQESLNTLTLIKAAYTVSLDS